MRYEPDEDHTTDGAWSTYARSESRYGRRHHDTDDRWQRYSRPLNDLD